MVRTLSFEKAPCHVTQFGIDDVPEIFHSRLIAVPDFLQNLCRVGGLCHVAVCLGWWRSKTEDLTFILPELTLGIASGLADATDEKRPPSGEAAVDSKDNLNSSASQRRRRRTINAVPISSSRMLLGSGTAAGAAAAT